MLSLAWGQKLREAGLDWQPQLHDFFGIPDRSMDDRVFTLSDMSIEIEILNGWPAITFNGSVEWALDYILQADAVWLPTETQLRELLEKQLVSGRSPSIQLQVTRDGYCCLVSPDGQEPFAFTAPAASEAYAAAVMHFLLHPQEG